MLDLLIFLVLLLIIIPFGRRVLTGIFHCEFDSFPEEIFVSFGLGAGLIALMVLYIGLIGLLYKWFIIAILTCIALFLIRDLAFIVKKAFRLLSGLIKTFFSPFELFLIISIVFVWFFTLIGSLGPLLGMDALSYHMRDPKLFIEAHKITEIPYTRESLWPFLMEMLFTLGLILKGPILSKIFHFAFGVFSIIGIYALCRRYWPRPNSLFAAAVFALIPAIFTDTTYAYTELGTTFYTLSVFYLFFVWIDKGDRRWFYLSALFCGFLMGIKITSAPVVAILLFLYLFNAVLRKETIRSILYSCSIFTVFFVMVCGVWYIRPWLITGNPIFPFAAYIFGYGYPEEYLRYHLIAGIGLSPLSYIRMLWPLTHYPDTFGGESIGPIFLIFLPMLLFIKERPSRFVRYIIFIALALYTSWFFTFQYTRFLSSTLPFFAMLVSYVYFDICGKDKMISKISRAVVILVFIYSAGLSVYHNIDKFKAAFGLEKQKDYLLRRERTYAMADYINKNLPEDSKIIVLGEPRLFYFDRYAAFADNIKMDMRYNRVFKYDGNFDEYLRLLKFGYILYSKDKTPGRIMEEDFTPEGILPGEKKALIKETKFAYRNERYEYQLWKLNGQMEHRP